MEGTKKLLVLSRGLYPGHIVDFKVGKAPIRARMRRPFEYWGSCGGVLFCFYSSSWELLIFFNQETKMMKKYF